MAGRFFLFSIHFVIWAILYQKNDFKISDGQKTTGEAIFASPVGLRHT